MKDGPLSNLTITKGGQQATQYKKIIDALPVFCADKGYRFIDNVICTNTELLKATFLPTYPEPALWSSTYHVQLDVVDLLVLPDFQGVCVLRTEIQQKSHIFAPNLQNQLLLDYNQKSKLKLQEWSKLTADKKSLMNIIYGQCNNATRTEITLGTNYETICEDGELMNFLTILRTVCYGSDNLGFSFKPYKNVVVVNSLKNFSNAKPNNPHGFKEELKIKYDAVLAAVGKCLNGTGPMLELLTAEVPPLNLAHYCAMDVAVQET